MLAAPESDRPSCNPSPRWLLRLARRFPGFCARYLELDPRVLGLARVYIGLLLLTDLVRRVRLIETFYSNDGLLPNHTLLWRPGAELQFSLFFLASLPHEAALLFALTFVVFLLFTLGYRTRLFHALAFAGIVSLHGRLILFDDGSETTTRLLCFWTLFLPMGECFSLDALRRARGEARAAAEPRPVRTLAVLAILLQLCAIYLFNFLHKDGQTWVQGSAVHYVLHQDRIVTYLGWKLRPLMSLELSRALCIGTLAIEGVLPILLLTPLGTLWARRLAIALGIALHLGFALLINVGLFSFNMIGFFLLLFSARDFAVLARLPWPGVLRRAAAAWVAFARRALAWLEGEPVARVRASPFQRSLSRWLPRAREALVVLFALALGSQLLIQNRAVPEALRVENQPFLFRLLVEYPRLYQGWSMFAPEAPLTDLHLIVDAVTVDGRHVDPLNELASRVAKTPLREIPEYLDQDDAFCDYALNIVNNPAYHSALRDWIFAYSDRTGHDRDRITRFRVIVLEDDSPPPGHSRARNTRSRELLKADAQP